MDSAKLAGTDDIGLRVGKVVNQYQVAKHLDLAIDEAAFSYQRKHDSIKAEAALDGIYIIRTSVPAAQMDAPQCVRTSSCACWPTTSSGTCAEPGAN